MIGSYPLSFSRIARTGPATPPPAMMTLVPAIMLCVVCGSVRCGSCQAGGSANGNREADNLDDLKLMVERNRDPWLKVAVLSLLLRRDTDIRLYRMELVAKWVVLLLRDLGSTYGRVESACMP